MAKEAEAQVVTKQQDAAASAAAVNQAAPSTAIVSQAERVKAAIAAQTENATKGSTEPQRVSFKGGNIIIGEMTVPNASCEVQIIAAQPERTFYAKKFDPNNTNIPACYSYDMEKPHADASAPAHTDCASCPNNQWGSGNEGRGKACREALRVALVPYSNDVRSAPIYLAGFPITSRQTVLDLVTRAGMAGKMLGQYKCRMDNKIDPRTFFKVSVTPLEVNDNPDYDALLEKMALSEDLLLTPYPVMTPAAPESTKY